MKIFTKFWNFLIVWAKTMEAYRKSQGKNFNNYI